MKIRPMGAELFHEDRQADRLDEAKSRFSQFCEKRLKTGKTWAKGVKREKIQEGNACKLWAAQKRYTNCVIGFSDLSQGVDCIYC